MRVKDRQKAIRLAGPELAYDGRNTKGKCFEKSQRLLASAVGDSVHAGSREK